MKALFGSAVVGMLLPVLFLAPGVPHADSSFSPAFTSADIVETTTAVDCLDWKIRGICLKLKCGLFGCRIRTVPWVEHRIPDLVVSAYNEPGRIPWTEASALYGRPLAAAADAVSRATVGVPLGGGHRTVTRPGGSTDPGSQSGDNLRYKEISILGNPATIAFRQWLTSGAVPVACSIPAAGSIFPRTSATCSATSPMDSTRLSTA